MQKLPRQNLSTLKRFFPAFLWAIIIFILSTMPSVQLPKELISPDKFAHAFVYGVLVILILYGLKQSDIFTKRNVWLAILGSASYGCLMEIIQYAFFPGRFFEMGDNLANITGCFLGLLFFDKFVKHRF
ncbi:MAG: VanZ family protein [Paraglaciecola sp.]